MSTENMLPHESSFRLRWIPSAALLILLASVAAVPPDRNRGWFRIPGWSRNENGVNRRATLIDMEAGMDDVVAEIVGRKSDKLIVSKEVEVAATEEGKGAIDNVKMDKEVDAFIEQKNKPEIMARIRDIWMNRPKDIITWRATVTIPMESFNVRLIEDNAETKSYAVIHENVVPPSQDPIPTVQTNSEISVETNDDNIAAEDEEGESEEPVVEEMHKRRFFHFGKTQDSVETVDENVAEEEENETKEPVVEETHKRRFFHFGKSQEQRDEEERKKKVEEGPIDYTKSPYSFLLYQEGDGSENDEDGLPLRYINMQRGNREAAKVCLEKTIKWRKENDIDTILARPHKLYDKCKTVFPHYFCGRDDTGHVILMQKPGGIDLDRGHKNDLNGKDLLFHYVFVMEYLWQILEPRPNETMTSIIDLEGISFSVLGKGELIGVVQMFCKVMDSHFPQRSYITFMINVPRWFNALYKLLSPLLRENTKKKIFIYSKGEKQDEALANLIKDRELPEGADVMELLQPAEMENDLREFVVARLEESGETMDEVV